MDAHLDHLRGRVRLLDEVHRGKGGNGKTKTGGRNQKGKKR